MTEQDVYASLKVIFEDIFFLDDVMLGPDTTANDIEGWDSMRQIEILMASEERFGVKFNTREIDNLKNVGDLVKIILEKVG